VTLALVGIRFKVLNVFVLLFWLLHNPGHPSTYIDVQSLSRCNRKLADGPHGPAFYNGPEKERRRCRERGCNLIRIKARQYCEGFPCCVEHPCALRGTQYAHDFRTNEHVNAFERF